MSDQALEPSRSGFLRNADLKTGGRCNNCCVHCPLPSRDEDESGEAYMEAISAAARAGHDSITVTGGEPTIHPALLDILANAKGLGLHVTLQTNGRLLSRPGFAAEIARYVDTFAIALHGPSASVHDAITRRHGSFEQTVAGVRNVARSGRLVVGKLVLTSLNAAHVLATARLMAELGFDFFVFSYVHGVGSARRNYDRIAVRYTDLWPEVRAAVDYLRSRSSPALLETFPYCIVSGYEPLVAELSFLAGAFHVKFKGRDIQDWGPARLEQKTKFEGCAECSFEPLCEGVWKEYPQRFGSAEFRPRVDRTCFERIRDRYAHRICEGRSAGHLPVEPHP